MGGAEEEADGEADGDDWDSSVASLSSFDPSEWGDAGSGSIHGRVRECSRPARSISDRANGVVLPSPSAASEVSAPTHPPLPPPFWLSLCRSSPTFSSSATPSSPQAPHADAAAAAASVAASAAGGYLAAVGLRDPHPAGPPPSPSPSPCPRFRLPSAYLTLYRQMHFPEHAKMRETASLVVHGGVMRGSSSTNSSVSSATAVAAYVCKGAPAAAAAALVTAGAWGVVEDAWSLGVRTAWH